VVLCLVICCLTAMLIRKRDRNVQRDGTQCAQTDEAKKRESRSLTPPGDISRDNGLGQLQNGGKSRVISEVINVVEESCSSQMFEQRVPSLPDSPTLNGSDGLRQASAATDCTVHRVMMADVVQMASISTMLSRETAMTDEESEGRFTDGFIGD